MNKQEAIEILTQVCNQYRGLLTEHQVIKEALKVVSELEAPVIKEPIDVKD